MAAADPSPVEPCKGWKDDCAFCDKRFVGWKEVGNDNEDDLKLTKPSAFMFAYQTKQSKEIVSIGVFSPDNKKNAVTIVFNELKQRIANKAFKETKSTIHFRYAALGQLNSKDSCVLFAHWYNYSVLPRLSTQWPGTEILENSPDFQFCTMSKKWCYASKCKVWKQQKTNTSLPKAVKKCKGWTDDCPFCNAQLTPWVSAEECLEKNMAPDAPGFLVSAGNDGSKRETVCVTRCIIPIKKVIRYEASEVRRHLHSDYCKCVPADKNKKVDVRWIVTGSKKPEQLAYLLVLAHWINSGTVPAIQKRCRTYDTPFDDTPLLEHDQFVFRERDKQWCFVADEENVKFKKNSPKHRRGGKHSEIMHEDDFFE